MRRRSMVLFAAVAVLAPLATLHAADGPVTVKVALVDVSSAMGMGGPGSGWGGGGWGGGRGMMGYGFAPPGTEDGQRGGPGWGPGGGWGGRWGGGGPGMMGSGMMGGGMMAGGMMAVRIDQSTVKAGPVHFDVTNWSRGMLHEVLIVAVDHPNAPLPYDYATAKVPEEQVKVLGDTGDMQPNASKTLDVTLAAGSYLLICNVPGHYAAGMVTPLTVTP